PEAARRSGRAPRGGSGGRRPPGSPGERAKPAWRVGTEHPPIGPPAPRRGAAYPPLTRTTIVAAPSSAVRPSSDESSAGGTIGGPLGSRRSRAASAEAVSVAPGAAKPAVVGPAGAPARESVGAA